MSGGPIAPESHASAADAKRRLETTLPPELISVSAARRWVTSTLRDWHVDASESDDVIELVKLLVSELATNVVLHARTPFRIVIELLVDRVLVSVDDGSVALPIDKRVSPDAATGRGLGLVAAMSLEHGVRLTPRGKEVWFSVDLVEQRRDTGASHWELEPDQRPASSQGPAAAVDLVRVTLLRFPLQIFARAREHHHDLMREFTLIALDPDTRTEGREVPDRFLALIEGLSRHYASLGAPVDVARDEALARGDATIDLAYDVPALLRSACAELGATLESADEYCRSEHLLTLETPEQARRFRAWFLGEFIAQMDGVAPTPWPGPLA